MEPLGHARDCEALMTEDADLLALVARVHATFDEIHRQVFLGDPVANPNLYVEVVAPARMGDTPTMVVVAPWTVNGLAFPPDEGVPSKLEIGGREHPVFSHELEALGRYVAINLVSDPRCFRDQEAARRSAEVLAPAFQAAVLAVREDPAVADPGRRRLLGLHRPSASERRD